MQHCVYEQTQDETLAHSRLSIHPRFLLFTAVRFMSYYTDYSPEPVTRTIIAVSCISIVGVLPLIGLSLVAKPAHLATRGTRVAWYLTGLAALILLSSHIVPLVVAVWFIRSPKMVTGSEGSDFGPVAFALMGLTLIFEIAACRSIFYATLPLGVTRAKKWTFIILDVLSFGALVGTFIGALVGTADYETGMCGNSCMYASVYLILPFNLITNCVPLVSSPRDVA